MADGLSRLIVLGVFAMTGLVVAWVWPALSWGWLIVTSSVLTLIALFGLIVFALMVESFTRSYGREP